MKKYLVFLFSPLLFSCSTDFDTVADYKEITVVYGLMNQYDSNEVLIRVNKAYLGEGNALIMAQEQDSINYPNTLVVTLEKINSGVVTASYPLHHYTGIPKDSGIFNYPYQVYYRLSRDSTPAAFPLSVSSEYRLRIHNDATGNEVSSVTAMLGLCPVEEPDPTDRLNFASPVYPKVELIPAARAKVYNISARFHYTDVENGTGNTTSRYFDWSFPDQVVDPTTVQQVYQVLTSPDFFRLMGENIPVDTHVTRQYGNPAVGGGLPMEIRIAAGSEDLYRYMQLTAPSNSVVQERPPFTNIINGTGLFTGRLMFSAFRDLHNNTLIAVDTSEYTRDLGF